MTDGQTVQAQKMRGDGFSYQKIGTALGVGRMTVYYRLNPTYRGRQMAYRATYNATHKEEKRLSNAIYNKNHLPEGAAKSAARRAMVLGTTIGDLAEIAEIYHRAKEASKVRCYLCKKLIPKGHRHVDHIMPLSKGGKHRPSNLAVACDTCNQVKNDRSPEEMGVLL